MKKTLLFSAFVSVGIALVAQPTITQSNLNRPLSFVDTFYSVSASSLSPANPGPNETYNYANISAQNQSLIVHSDASDSTVGYPSDLHDYSSFELYSFLGDPLGGTEFYKLDANEWSIAAYYFSNRVVDNLAPITGNANDSLFFAPQRTILDGSRRLLSFPTSYQSTWTDTSRRSINFSLTFNAQNLINVPGSRDLITIQTREVVGYGQLTVPDENGVPLPPVEVLMIKSQTLNIDSIYLGGAPAPAALLSSFGLSQGATSTGDDRYFFYAPGTYLPIFNYWVDAQGSIVGATLRPDQGRSAAKYVGLSQLDKNNLAIYPNPLHQGENLRVEIPQGQNWQSFKIFSPSGVLMAQDNIGASHQNVELEATSALGKGVYIIQFLGEKQQALAQSRFVIH